MMAVLSLFRVFVLSWAFFPPCDFFLVVSQTFSYFLQDLKSLESRIFVETLLSLLPGQEFLKSSPA